jgi:hypothetical protein
MAQNLHLPAVHTASWAGPPGAASRLAHSSTDPGKQPKRGYSTPAVHHSKGKGCMDGVEAPPGLGRRRAAFSAVSGPGCEKSARRPAVWILASKASSPWHRECRRLGDCGVEADMPPRRPRPETVRACISRTTEAQNMIDPAWSRPGPRLQNAPSFVSAAYLVAELHILGHGNKTCMKTH